MADAYSKLSRRTLLGAVCATPVLSAVEGPPPAACSAWNRALLRFQKADARIRALEGGADDDVFDRALDSFNIALRRLLAAPAPDLAALALKLEAAVEAEVAELTYGPASLAALVRDARRLSSS